MKKISYRGYRLSSGDFGGSIRFQIVCDQLVWDKAILLQELAHEFQRGTLVPPAPN